MVLKISYDNETNSNVAVFLIKRYTRTGVSPSLHVKCSQITKITEPSNDLLQHLFTKVRSHGLDAV